MTSSHLRVEQGLEFDHGFIWMMYFFLELGMQFGYIFVFVFFMYHMYTMNHMQ